MKSKWLKTSFSVFALLVMGLALLPTPSAHAGFVANEEPAQNTVSYAPSNGHSALLGGSASAVNATFHRKSFFPMAGRYIIVPGRAFRLQFYIPYTACVCKEKHECFDYRGDACFP